MEVTNLGFVFLPGFMHEHCEVDNYVVRNEFANFLHALLSIMELLYMVVNLGMRALEMLIRKTHNQKLLDLLFTGNIKDVTNDDYRWPHHDA